MRGSPEGELVGGLSHRHRVILDAVRAGRCQLTLGRLPALLVDGRACGDPAAADDLLVAGLVEAAADSGGAGRLVARAVLSADGVRVLGSALRVASLDGVAQVPEPRRA